MDVQLAAGFETLSISSCSHLPQLGGFYFSALDLPLCSLLSISALCSRSHSLLSSSRSITLSAVPPSRATLCSLLSAVPPSPSHSSQPPLCRPAVPSHPQPPRRRPEPPQASPPCTDLLLPRFTISPYVVRKYSEFAWFFVIGSDQLVKVKSFGVCMVLHCFCSGGRKGLKKQNTADTTDDKNSCKFSCCNCIRSCCGGKEESNYSEVASQLKEIAIAFKNQGPVDANELYEAVMSTEGFAEEMLASAFDYMIQEEKVGRAFMAKAPRLRKLWLENYFTKNM
uniref:Uncharacterized protein n=1 Tax=Fagus sylvatica TaxID=28930 RepID=A0A2N9FRD5_FAGSY